MSCERHRPSRNAALRAQLAGDELCGEELEALGLAGLFDPPAWASDSEPPPPAPSQAGHRPPVQRRRRVDQGFPPDDSPPASSPDRAGG